MPRHKKRKLNPKMRVWIDSFKAARESLGIKGFRRIKKGTRFYKVTRAIYDKSCKRKGLIKRCPMP